MTCLNIEKQHFSAQHVAITRGSHALSLPATHALILCRAAMP